MASGARVRRKRYKNPEFRRVLGEHIRELRTRRGYSIDRLSRESEQLSPAVIYRLENGLSDVQISVLLRISDTLDLPLWKLLQFKGGTA